MLAEVAGLVNQKPSRWAVRLEESEKYLFAMVLRPGNATAADLGLLAGGLAPRPLRRRVQHRLGLSTLGVPVMRSICAASPQTFVNNAGTFRACIATSEPPRQPEHYSGSMLTAIDEQTGPVKFGPTNVAITIGDLRSRQWRWP